MTNEQSVSHKSDHRIELIHSWLHTLEKINPYQLSPLAGDASFRRYFRLQVEKCSYIVMDAPPDHENCQPFITVANLLHRAKVNVPQLLAMDIHQGFLLLSDFGDRQLLQELTVTTADHFYTLALQNLIPLQNASTSELPRFDQAFMRTELERFETWYLGNNRRYTLSVNERQLLESTYQLLIQSAIEQPQLFIHRDYHSRNLMIINHQQLGILDFQDAMLGPFTYDVVSLLHDCYITWPRHKVLQWAQQYLENAQHAKLVSCIDPQQFIQWFDWMGLQRHLKVLGIFSRLYLRDGKANFLQDIPRVLSYVLDVSKEYPQLSDFNQFMRKLCTQP